MHIDEIEVTTGYIFNSRVITFFFLYLFVHLFHRWTGIIGMLGLAQSVRCLSENEHFFFINVCLETVLLIMTYIFLNIK